MFSMKKIGLFLPILLSAGPFLSATLATEHEAFIEDWTPYHQDILRNEPEGSYVFFAIPRTRGTYALLTVKNGALSGYLFRHDDGYIQQREGFSIRFHKNQVEDVDLLVENRPELKIIAKEEVNKKALKLKEDEKRRVAELHKNQPWRRKAMKRIKQSIESGYHRSEENDELEIILMQLNSDQTFTRKLLKQNMVYINNITAEKNALKAFNEKNFF